jgi:uncharacterized protein (DUF305 family)
MKKRIWPFAILSILVLTLTPVERGQDSHSQTSQSQTSLSIRQSKWLELVESMHVMHTAMTSVQPTGNNDVDFVKLMLPHHQAAIDMAKTQLLYGQDPQMRRLAQEIITDQQSEIELMQLWLKQREAKSSTAKNSPSIHTSKEQ